MPPSLRASVPYGRGPDYTVGCSRTLPPRTPHETGFGCDIGAGLVPVAVYGPKVDWPLASDAMSARRETALGWCIVAAALLGGVACAVIVANVT
ncbi:MAG: hypothetical protein ABTD50_23270 [Polyangiaceae bacterium]